MMKSAIISFCLCAAGLLYTGCSPARPAVTSQPPAVQQPPQQRAQENKPEAQKAEAPPAPARQPSQKNEKPASAEKKEKRAFVPTAVDSASMGNEIMLSKAKIRSENVIEGADIKDAESTHQESPESKIINGFRIQVYATTDFKEAERKKENLQLGLEDRVYVVYEAPFYKIRAGNFETEAKAKDLKKTLGEMGYETWIVPSKIRKSGK